MRAVVKSKLDYVLRKLFYDPKSTVAFTGKSQLYEATKSVLKGIRYKDVQDWLRSKSTYTLHKPIRRRFKRRKTIVLYQVTKSVLKGIRYKDVQDWLRVKSTYTLHKPVRRRFKRRKTIVCSIDYQWQAGLADIQHLAKQNNNKKIFILCD